MRRRAGYLSAAAAALCMMVVNDAEGQAWVQPRGDGAVTFSYQRIDNTGHRRTNGLFVRRGTSLDTSLFVETEFGLTRRLSLSAGLPYVFAKYTDAAAPPPPIPFLPQDECRCWQSGWQDVSVTARYNLVGGASGALALTPSVSVGAPSHEYNFRGEAALGRNLTEARFGIDAGRRLDIFSSSLAIQGGYSYAVVEEVSDISTNRSNARLEADYVLKRKLQVLGQVFWQRTHGGLRFGSPVPPGPIFPGEVNTPELLYQHDRLLRDNYWHAGGGLAYSFSRIDVFATYIGFVGGTDTHAGSALTVAVAVPFRLSSRHP